MSLLFVSSIERNIADEARISEAFADAQRRPDEAKGHRKIGSRLWLGGFDRLNVLLPGAGTTEAVGAMSIRLAGLFVVAGVLLVVRVLRALFGVRLLHARVSGGCWENNAGAAWAFGSSR
jgi:hypothetical protein